MILDYRMKENREWLSEAIRDPRFSYYVENRIVSSPRPVLTPTGRIKAGSKVFCYRIRDPQTYKEFLSFLHYDSQLSGQWVVITGKMLNEDIQLAVVQDDDTVILELAFSKYEYRRYVK